MEDILTIYEVADFVGVHQMTVRNDVRCGRIIPLALSKKVNALLFDMPTVLAWIELRRSEGKKVAY